MLCNKNEKIPCIRARAALIITKKVLTCQKQFCVYVMKTLILMLLTVVQLLFNYVTVVEQVVKLINIFQTLQDNAYQHRITWVKS